VQVPVQSVVPQPQILVVHDQMLTMPRPQVFDQTRPRRQMLVAQGRAEADTLKMLVNADNVLSFLF